MARARKSPATKRPRPFLKWAGGKRQLLPVLLDRVPKSCGTYHEPFLGGGALFFALGHAPAVLYDTNTRLIRTWKAVRDEVDPLIGLLSAYPHDRDFFHMMRGIDIDGKQDVEVAAWLIYLSKTAFNGLYRVNSDNRFNVPFGRYASPRICDAENLRACSAALKGVEIVCGDFAHVSSRASRKDFVYFDPPYDPISPTASFTGYSAGGFSMAEQVRLRDVARDLKKRGVRVLLSNSDTEQMRLLYRRGFVIEMVGASRSINSRADRRGRISELLIR